MIRQLLLPVIALLVLGSCSNKMSLVKRKYNKGFYVSVSRKNNTEQTAKETSRIKTTSAVETPAEKRSESVAVNETSTSSAEALVNPLSERLAKKDEKNHTQLTASAEKTEKNIQKPEVRSLKNKELMKISPKGKGASDDKIIQIILALFPILCLIAIYLHDGKSITLNFWIDLILHITFLGEIIFALLVVLDVINLA